MASIVSSTEAIDRSTISLCLTNDLLTENPLPTQSFRLFLESYSANLEHINASFPCDGRLLEILPEFSYPKLNHFEFALGGSSIVKDSFTNLIKRNRNIRSITLWLGQDFEFPPDVIFDQLEQLEIHCATGNNHVLKTMNEEFNEFVFEKMLKSLIGRVSQLKHLVFMADKIRKGFSTKINLQVLNDFMASIRNLTSLHLYFTASNVLDGFIDQLPHLWRLESLIDLRLEIGDKGDDGFQPLDSMVLHKISISFPKLETFTSGSVLEIGFILLSLSKLKYLRKLCLPNLVMARFVFMDIVASFPALDHLEIDSIEDVSSTKMFVNLLTSIPDNKKSLSIQFNNDDFKSIWDSECVSVLLENMMSNGGPNFLVRGKE